MHQFHGQCGCMAKPIRLAVGAALAAFVAVAGGGSYLLRCKGTAPQREQYRSAHRPADGRPASAPTTQALFAARSSAARLPLQARSSSAHRPSAGAAKEMRTNGTIGGPSAPGAKATRTHRPGESPEYAASHGWPVKTPPLREGSILPAQRIVAYYGNPLSRKMGALGEYRKDDMLARLMSEAARWEKADPGHPVQPALHLIISVAQGTPGAAGTYRMIMPDKVVEEVYGWARSINALLFIDIQTGHDSIRTLLPRFEWILRNRDVHLGIDPEFNLIGSGRVPGTSIGTYDASDINFVAGYLEGLVEKHHLPPKVLVVHRFTQNGVTNSKAIRLRSDVQIVMDMDGWGAPWLKRESYRDFIVREPVQYTGFKLFYHNDTRQGDPLLTPAEILKLEPKPLYILYQ